MANHIIIIFDHSGSMSEPFTHLTSTQSPRGLSASYAIKIDEAKDQLISWLETSNYDKVTIVPFSSDADEPLTVALPSEMPQVRSYIHRFQADGNTNLAAALGLALKAGAGEPEDTFVRYLIVTDGLSHTQAKDIALVSQLPPSQGIDGILINPTDEGESHLKRLCVRGRYIPVYGPPDLQERLLEQQAAYEARTLLAKQYAYALTMAQDVLPQLSTLRSRLLDDSSVSAPLRQSLSGLYATLVQATESSGDFRKKLANSNIPASVLEAEIAELEKACQQAKELVEALSEYYAEEPRFRLSLGYPRRLSKGYASTFLVQLYPPERRRFIERRLQTVFKASAPEEVTSDSSLKPEMTVEIAFSSPEIEFSKPVRKAISQSGAEVAFWARPKELAKPGTHSGVLTIRDSSSRTQYESVAFEVQIVDYAFDHISRPLFGNMMTFAVGAGSLLTFVLGLMGQIEKTFGLTSGTIGGAIAAFIFTGVFRFYKQRGITITHPE